MDLLVNVERPTELELRSDGATDSETARAEVLEARQRQIHRLKGTGARCNGELTAQLVRRLVELEPAAERVLGHAYAAGALSARGRHRVLRVARTVADLHGHGRVDESDVLLALSLRQRGGGELALAAA
jgi:magnesium chelatase family protein